MAVRSLAPLGEPMDNIKESLYEVVGVGQNATREEIEAACLALGERYRPDRNSNSPGAAAKFAAVENAYKVLSDPVRRAEYDNSLSDLDTRSRGVVASRPRWAAWSLTLLVLVIGALGAGGWYLLYERPSGPSKAATDAYVALKKLAAATETGVNYAEYRRLLGETWFVVKTYLETRASKEHPDIRDSIANSMQAYSDGAEVWKAKLAATTNHQSKYLRVTDCPNHQREECERGRALLATVTGVETFIDRQGRTVIALDDELQRQWQIARQRLSAAQVQMH